MWFIFSISNLQLWFTDLHQWVVLILNIKKHKKYFSFLLVHQEKQFQANILKTKKKRMFKKISNNLDSKI
jgi:hypothetical protein